MFTDEGLDLTIVAETYRKARFILEVLGNGEVYVGDRLEISGDMASLLLQVLFDNRDNTGRDYPAQCLSVSSSGDLRFWSIPHGARIEGGGYRPWLAWLNEQYEIAKRKEKST